LSFLGEFGELEDLGPDFHLLGKCLLELALEEARHLTELEVDHILLQPLRVPQRQANPLIIDLGLEVMGNKVARGRRLRGEIVLVDGALGPLLSRKRKGVLEELEERCLARVCRADDEDAVVRPVSNRSAGSVDGRLT
jgi:hypothetical protein